MVKCPYCHKELGYLKNVDVTTKDHIESVHHNIQQISNLKKEQLDRIKEQLEGMRRKIHSIRWQFVEMAQLYEDFKYEFEEELNIKNGDKLIEIKEEEQKSVETIKKELEGISKKIANSRKILIDYNTFDEDFKIELHELKLIRKKLESLPSLNGTE